MHFLLFKTLVIRPGLSIRQSRQIPRVCKGKGPSKVNKEAHEST